MSLQPYCGAGEQTEIHNAVRLEWNGCTFHIAHTALAVRAKLQSPPQQPPICVDDDNVQLESEPTWLEEMFVFLFICAF